MWFWIKHLTLAALLLLLVALVMLRPEWLIIKPEHLSERSSDAVKGFTNFYTSVRDSLDSSMLESGDYVVELNDDYSNLVSLLKERANRMEALPDNWQGNRGDRRFRAGDTLKTVLTAEGRKEGIELFWVLARDYKVKHYFQTDFSYLSAIRETASAISTDFEDPVQAYFCPKSRAVILTDQAISYLQQSCININAPQRRLSLFSE